MPAARANNREKWTSMTEMQILQLVALLMMAILVVPGFIYFTRRAGMAASLRNLAIWLAIALVIALLYRTFGSG